MKKILFPFSKKHQDLNTYWWHRLLVVVFFVLVLLTGVFTWEIVHNYVPANQSACQTINYQSYNFNTNSGYYGDYDKYITGIQNCIDTNHTFDYGFGFFAVIMSFYIFQLIYYKVILYIVFAATETKLDK